MDRITNMLGVFTVACLLAAGVWHYNHTVSLAQNPKVHHANVAPAESD